MEIKKITDRIKQQLDEDLVTNEYIMTPDVVNEIQDVFNVTIPNHFKGEKVTFTTNMVEVIAEYAADYIEKAFIHFKDDFLSEFEVEIDRFIRYQKEDGVYYGIRGKDYDSHKELLFDDESFSDDVIEYLVGNILSNVNNTIRRMIKLLIENQRLDYLGNYLGNELYIETFH